MRPSRVSAIGCNCMSTSFTYLSIIQRGRVASDTSAQSTASFEAGPIFAATQIVAIAFLRYCESRSWQAAVPGIKLLFLNSAQNLTVPAQQRHETCSNRHVRIRIEGGGCTCEPIWRLLNTQTPCTVFNSERVRRGGREAHEGRSRGPGVACREIEAEARSDGAVAEEGIRVTGARVHHRHVL